MPAIAFKHSDNKSRMRCRVQFQWRSRPVVEGLMSTVLAYSTLQHLIASLPDRDMADMPTLDDIHNAMPGQVFKGGWENKTGAFSYYIEVLVGM